MSATYNPDPAPDTGPALPDASIGGGFGRTPGHPGGPGGSGAGSGSNTTITGGGSGDKPGRVFGSRQWEAHTGKPSMILAPRTIKGRLVEPLVQQAVGLANRTDLSTPRDVLTAGLGMAGVTVRRPTLPGDESEPTQSRRDMTTRAGTNRGTRRELLPE